MIRIQNIYYMLSYAFQVLNEDGYKQVATEEFENAAELCTAILIKGVSSQLKRGLGKEYIVQTEELSSLRGKIDISASVKEQTMLRKRLVCNYDEFSVNSYMNRIIRTTMDTLIRSNISKDRKKQLRKLLIYFAEVEPLNRESINWKLQFNKNNQTYQMLISICYLILKGLLQTTSDGSTKLMDFLDEQRMCRLYEKFILEYFKKEHPEVKASASQIPWDTDDGYREMLPVMQSDIMLKSGDKTLVIDAKYYAHTTQSQYNTNTLHSGNLYQIFTYVKNLDTSNSGSVTGHDAAIKETARLTDERLELSDEVIMRLNDQLNMIRDNIGTEQEVSITYFVPDDKKSGGAYLTHSGVVKKIDEFERKLIMQDETVIPIEQISEIQGEIFKGLYE